MHRRAPRYLSPCLIALFAAPALAGTPEPAAGGADPVAENETPDGYRSDAAAGTTVVETSLIDPRSYAAGSLLVPERSTQVGGELVFLTGRADPASGQPLHFTDVVLLRPRARRSFGRVELGVGVDLLAKQASTGEDAIWQGASVGGRVAIRRRWAAFLHTGGGTTRAAEGLWGGAAAGAQWRHAIADFAAFQLDGGAGATAVRQGDAATAWITELGLGGKVVFYTPHGEAGVWLGTDFAFPLYDRGPFDPHTRVRFRVGAVLAAIDDWDLYVEGVIADRGEVDAPATTLPVLDGGFDQTQLVFGVVRRFRPADTRPYQMMAY
jgi:hypothetical protein